MDDCRNVNMLCYNNTWAWFYNLWNGGFLWSL